MSEYGPFESEREALATRAAALIRAAFDANPGPGASFPAALKVMTDACEETGVVLGDYDLRLLRWLSEWETANAVSFAAMIRRAYEAGKAAGPDGAVTEWGARFRDEAGRLSAMAECGSGPEGEQTARSIAGTSKRDNLTGIVFCREVGPWKEAPDA